MMFALNLIISFEQVLEMLERGETPPNVRTDINDKPPNPNQAPPSSHAQPRLKPWEKSGSSSSANKGKPLSSTSEC